MAIAGAHAVAAGVAAADHDHVLAGSRDLALDLVTGHHLVLLRQELHREVHAVELASRRRQVAAGLGAAGQQHGVELRLQLLCRDRFLGVVGDQAAFGQRAHQHAGAKRHALGAHLLDATIDVRLLHLEVGDAVTQQTADAAVLLEHRHVMAGARELLGCGQAGGTRADDGHLLAGLRRGRLRQHPTLGPGAIGDRVLDRLDAHRIVVDVERAGGLARRRAHAAGELRKVVGRVQHLGRQLPVVAIHEVVEVRNDVVDRAAAVAKRRAAVHAARALHLGLIGRQRDDEFLPRLQPLRHGLVALFDAPMLEKPRDFAHVVTGAQRTCALVVVAVATWLERRAAWPAPSWPWRSWPGCPRRPCVRPGPCGTRAAAP